MLLLLACHFMREREEEIYGKQVNQPEHQMKQSLWLQCRCYQLCSSKTRLMRSNSEMHVQFASAVVCIKRIELFTLLCMVVYKRAFILKRHDSIPNLFIF